MPKQNNITIPPRSRVLNVNAQNSLQIQQYKKNVIERASQDIAKIEQEIEQLGTTQ